MNNLCILYASKYHLSLIVLEYLKNKNTKKYTINTFLQNPIEDEINVLEQKYKLKYNAANAIDFKATQTINKKQIQKNKNMIFINEGNLKYIKEVNNYIKEKTKNEKYEDVIIINCFDFCKETKSVDKIVKEHDRILYTSGIKHLTNLL